MKKHLRHITIFLLAANVLVASTGLSVHQLYCYCKGKTIASLFHIDDPCDTSSGKAEASCCQGGQCGRPAGAPDDKHQCNSGCNSEYVKLDTPYLLCPSEFKLSVPVVAPAALFLEKWECAIDCSVPPFYSGKSPPPLTGKERLIFLQTFLC